jgi:primary-amine oxidase
MFLATINIFENFVKEIKQIESHFHGQADVDEILDMRDACLKQPEVIEAIEKYQLPDHLKVVCDSWPYGRDSDDHHPRYVQVCNIILWSRREAFTFSVRCVSTITNRHECYLFAEGDHPGANHYDIPLPFSPVLDMTTRKLVKLIHLPTGPNSIPRHDSVYTPHLAKECHQDLQTQPARRDLKPLKIHQPQGVSFSGDGYLIRWQKWRFRLGFNWREGMVLHDVTYDGRELFHRISLSEMFVPYGDPRMPYSRKSVFDVGDIGAGVAANNLALGCDCLGAIKA